MSDENPKGWKDPLGPGETVYATDPNTNNAGPDEGEGEKPDYQSKEWLYHQYKILGRTFEETAEASSSEITPGTIKYWIDKHDIETRKPSEYVTKSQGDGKLRDKSWLKTEYVEKEKSGTTIANERGCDPKTVYRWLDNHGIEKRDPAESNVPDENYTNAEWLFQEHHIKGKTIRQIADEQGVARTTIWKWMDRGGVPSKSMCQANHDKWAAIKKRPYSEGELKELVTDSGELDFSHRSIDERIYQGEDVLYRNKTWLKSKIEEGLSYGEIADLAGCHVSTIKEYAATFDINTGKIGEDHYLSKFTDEKVRKIRETYANGDVSLSELASEYDTVPSNISLIINGKTWRHAPGPIKGEDYSTSTRSETADLSDTGSDHDATPD